MRKRLEKYEGKKLELIATFKLLRERNGHGNIKVQSMLLLDLQTLGGKVLARHTWVTHNRKFQLLDLKEGDRVKFIAKVIPYQVTRNGIVEKDYCLTHTTKAQLFDNKINV